MRRPSPSPSPPPEATPLATPWLPTTGTPADRRRNRAMRVIGPSLGIVWAVFLQQPWSSAWAAPAGPERIVSLVCVAALALLFAAVVIRFRPMRPRWARRPALAVIAVQLLLVAGACLAARQDGLVGLVFVCVSALFLVRGLLSLVAAPVAIVLVLVVPRLVPGWRTIDDLTVSVLLATTAVFGFSQLVERNRQLQASQDEVAVLAVDRERDRIARDMHDVLGHSLTVIAVKADLAARLAELDPARARAEMLAVQTLARGALADSRRMVSATHTPALAAELAGARSALETAGIAAELPGAVDEVPEGARALFAWAVREGTTNVLRHAGATRVRITLEPRALTVDDDGTGVADPAAAGAGGGPGTGAAGGHGLPGLQERAQSLGGSVWFGPSPLGGARLRVSLAGASRPEVAER